MRQQLQAHAPPHEAVAALAALDGCSSVLRAMLIRPANSMPSVARPDTITRTNRILARVMRQSPSLCRPAPVRCARPRPCICPGIGAGRDPEDRLGRLLARPQGRVHRAVLDRLGRLAGEEHPPAERPRMRLAILGRAADARVGIAAARPRIAQPARKDHRLRLGNVIAEHLAQRGHRHFLHFGIARRAVKVAPRSRRWRS